MELNGITCIGYKPTGNVVAFDLECDFADALALDGEELKVTADGSDLAVFGGYQLTGLEVNGDYTHARFAMALEPNVEQMLSAIQQNLEIARKAADTADTKAKNAQTSATNAATSANDANTLANANAEAIEELAAAVFTE